MNPAQHILIFAVRIYRVMLSPLKVAVLGPAARCRFTPSCSAYALEAVRCHGALRGLWLAMRRVGRCHPWGGCGHDPVPEPRSPGAAPPARDSEAKPAAVSSSRAARASLPRPSLST